jgi:hypothetical protein
MEAKENDASNKRYVPLHLLLRIGVARRVTTRRGRLARFQEDWLSDMRIPMLPLSSVRV